MKCPVCDRDLKEMSVGDIRVDTCQGGCGGIWFDLFELQKFDEKHEAAGEALLDLKRDPLLKKDHEKKHHCPRCQTIFMMKHFFSIKREVEIDECPKCGGFWLDFGELGKIRNQFHSTEERKRAAKAYFNDLFRKDLQRAEKESKEKLARIRKVTNLFRFICPSYYIPGDQEWGAF